MATKAAKPIPEGMHTVTPVLNFNGNCEKAIEFYKKAFQATVVGEIAKGPGGMVLHALIKIGDANVMLSDLMGKQDNPVGLYGNMWIYIDDCDSMFNKAISAGAVAVWPLTDQFWGDRVGVIKDPFNHQWSIATLKFTMSQEEMQKKQDEWMKTMKW